MRLYVNKVRLYETKIKSIWRQGSKTRHPQILGDTQDTSMIKTVKTQGHGASDFGVFTENLKCYQTKQICQRITKRGRERENLWHKILFCVLVIH